MKDLTDIYPYNYAPPGAPRASLTAIEKYLTGFYNRQTLVLSSARVGIYLALKYYNLKRWDHILVPEYTCQSILNILNISSFPVQQFDNKTKAVLLLHQWGYPQEMEKVLAEAKKRNLIVIEDCAHALDSHYQGRLLGTFGDVAVFSFSKLLTTYLGGFFLSSDQTFINFVNNYRASKKNYKNILFNQLAYCVARKSFLVGKWRGMLDILYQKSVHFPNLKKKILKFLPAELNAFQAALARRQKNYLYLKNNLKPELIPIDQNPDFNVNPLCLPVFLPVAKLPVARTALLAYKIYAEILHFDVNRNIFEPDYRECLAVPSHGQLTVGELKNIVTVLNQA